MTAEHRLDALEESAAHDLDAADPLAHVRDRFDLPRRDDGTPAVYLAGQSLGARPVGAVAAVEAELDAWARLGVEGWFVGERPWMEADGVVRESTARIVGARAIEVATLNTLTIDLHLLLATFYRPTGRRTAILIDAPTFPSDRYAIDSHLRLRGLDPIDDLVVVGPRSGESVVRPEDLEGAVHEHRDRLALVLLAGINYATGQRLDIERLTSAVHAAGSIAGWDLTHAAGNVPLALHDADVDFAVWCTYKYLNSGPGGPAQIFVHERHATDADVLRLAGWWGNDPATRFEMTETFRPAAGAEAWRVSTPAILSLAPLRVSLAIFDEVGMAALRQKSIALTAYLETLIVARVPDAVVLTPSDPEARGAQLSIGVPDARSRLAALESRGVIVDFREPDILRVAPTPLYNRYHEAWSAVDALAATA